MRGRAISRARLLPLLLLLCPGLPCPTEAREQPALQLLRPNDERNRTGLVVVESTLAYIEALEVSSVCEWSCIRAHSTDHLPHRSTQHPVAVIGITGPYHTGKSFLLNQVARSLPDAAADATSAGAAAQGKGEGGPAEEELFVIGRGVDPETSGQSVTPATLPWLLWL
jgi:hypothetical protein